MWDSTPRESIAVACEQRGVAAVVDGCIALLGGEDVDPELVAALGGPGQERYLDAPEEQRYWLRVWGARGLLWGLPAGGDDPRVAAAIGSALGDGHWRVREMAAKVVARHRVEGCQPAVAQLLTDENARVRAAAARAVRLLR
jgi:HEAT repeat protein